ncbi:MAG: hypothetical protein GW893_13025 [Armatimonadetes bacterium]|nr:hypothetical protein [Armatimonadota bacterium]PIU60255.1 MAG: hypothetical protein COS85_25420 [Armatimonadetes bacterium CG07_land_8_20_14_0_80_59_28]PIX41456.1 MAG: hypothetical protein COZ56_12085 [Armatimonadetes bacterium CG_4_8_14_3_um_filter_58_9]PIY47113.1 MAG: hypothetical protein COZ05_05290 [Armatimonadetes bacterium CG_4_10_14_3_um_filter_59_10]PJB76690.1 MAG: hypothetical protein CO095_02220 [Armatimonadetes bacterium CG_4_9_14_3_um_filter_58_7]
MIHPAAILSLCSSSLAKPRWAVAAIALCLFLCHPSVSYASLAELKENLLHGKPVCYLALGDSITYGYGLEEPKRDSFARAFSQALRRAFHNSNLRYVNGGVSGDKLSEGLERLPELLKKYRPDIMTVQFGGNDFREKTPVDEFKANLTAIVEMAQKECGTFVVLITPPMADDAPRFDAWVVEAVREVALKESVLVVDSDTLLKKTPHDYRGLFPYEAHPTEYSHRQLAALLWNAFASWIGFESHVDVRIEPAVALLDGNNDLSVAAQLRNLTLSTQEFRLELETGGTVRVTESLLAPSEERRVVVPLPLSTVLEGMRTSRSNLVAGVRTRSGYSCDLNTLSLSPQVSVASAEDESAPSFDLDITRPTVGSYSWDGPDDLSASFSLQREGEFLAINIHIRDEKVSPAKLASPYDGDSVEVYLDLRKPAQQGKPFFTKETIILYVLPGEEDIAASTLLSSEPAPRKFEGMAATCKPANAGYDVDLRLPMEWFSRYTADPNASFGFDIAVNDSDDWYGRETQLVWAGSDLNYLNPGLFGAFSFGSRLSPGALRATVQ